MHQLTISILFFSAIERLIASCFVSNPLNNLSLLRLCNDIGRPKTLKYFKDLSRGHTKVKREKSENACNSTSFFVEYIHLIMEKRARNRNSKLTFYSYFNHGQNIDPLKCKEGVLALVKLSF